MASKSVQISLELWHSIMLYFLSDDTDRHDLEQNILDGISKKLDAQIKHDLYSKYKSAPTAEQREQARIDYLDKAGIKKDFRY